MTAVSVKRSIQMFFDRSFTWSLIYFSAKFLEILTTGSLEIGMFLLKQSVSIFRSNAHALHLTGFHEKTQVISTVSMISRGDFCFAVEAGVIICRLRLQSVRSLVVGIWKVLLFPVTANVTCSLDLESS